MARTSKPPCRGGCDRTDLLVQGVVDRCQSCGALYRWVSGRYVPLKEGAKVR